ncbi:hypothetical protein OPQ81_007431 [Rhizoctonia solani]|nr:hypothetical protein OPQ81_007431 [Rhizoctonia solani]
MVIATVPVRSSAPYEYGPRLSPYTVWAGAQVFFPIGDPTMFITRLFALDAGVFFWFQINQQKAPMV